MSYFLIKVKTMFYILLTAVGMLHSFQSQAQAQAQAFELDVDNAALFLVTATSSPIVTEQVSKTGGDATLLIRFGALITNAWFDSTAPYHSSAVGVYSRLGRRPEGEATVENMNIALIYASYHVLNSFLPSQSKAWRKMLVDVGLDPDDSSKDLTTPVGIGNVAGMAVVKGRENDGMNQLGNEGGRTNNLMPYMDYTGYRPVNTAYRLRRPSRWQPDIQQKQDQLGIYKIQQFVTPQYSLVEPYSYESPQQFWMPPPYKSHFKNRQEFRQQAKEVLSASASLTDTQKLKAELFDNKLQSLANSFVQEALSRKLSLLDVIHFHFLVNMATFDAGIFVWDKKVRYDAVRPFSAIRKLYGNSLVTAWGGPGKGTVQLPAGEWKSYMEEADHPEYPSASTCFCQAHAQVSRLFLGEDNISFRVDFAAGSSRIEPGVTPAKDTTIRYDTWTEFAQECGQSRVWAGVHFQAAVDESAARCGVFGDYAYDYVESLVKGTAPVRPPSKGAVPSPGFPHK